MIEKHFLFPDCYVAKEPKCDDCKLTLIDTGYVIDINPIYLTYKCPKCNKEYNFTEDELRGEWKFRVL